MTQHAAKPTTDWRLPRPTCKESRDPRSSYRAKTRSFPARFPFLCVRTHRHVSPQHPAGSSPLVQLAVVSSRRGPRHFLGAAASEGKTQPAPARSQLSVGGHGESHRGFVQDICLGPAASTQPAPPSSLCSRSPARSSQSVVLRLSVEWCVIVRERRCLSA
jgi:hypothetical protein